jgi:hypothetical protein
LGAKQTNSQEGFEGYHWVDGSSWTYTHANNDSANNTYEPENVTAMHTPVGLYGSCSWEDWGNHNVNGGGAQVLGTLCKLSISISP